MADVLLRTSERMTYTRCRQQWFWRFEDRLEPIRTKPVLRFGTLWHDALATYYKPGKKRGPHPARTFKKLYDASGGFLMSDEGDKVDAGELGIDMAENYVDTFGSDAAIEVIQPEMPFAVRVKDAGGSWFWYVGRFDAVIRYKGEVGLFEHKTAAEILLHHLALDEQVGSYWAFAPEFLAMMGIVPKGTELDMVLYNIARKAMRDLRPENDLGQKLNKNGEISKIQPAPLFERINVYRDEDDRRSVKRRIRLQAWEMRMVREGKIPVFKNIMRNCSWDCPFYDMCELHETGSDWRSFADQNYKPGDPYAEYRQDLKEVMKRGRTTKKATRVDPS